MAPSVLAKCYGWNMAANLIQFYYYQTPHIGKLNKIRCVWNVEADFDVNFQVGRIKNAAAHRVLV